MYRSRKNTSALYRPTTSTAAVHVVAAQALLHHPLVTQIVEGVRALIVDGG
jgi:hypothetical protein